MNKKNILLLILGVTLFSCKENDDLLEEKTPTVILPDVEGVMVSPYRLSLFIGNTRTVEATVLPDSASQEVRWSSSNPAVATVTDGVITTLKQGSTSIIAKSVADSTKFGDLLLTVEDSIKKLPIDERIDHYRKEDVCIRVTRNGAPIVGASVAMTMQNHEFLFGCNIGGWSGNATAAQDLEFRRLFADIFNFATLSIFWGSFERVKDQPNYAFAGQVAEWCAERDIRVKGHPLIYYDRSPNWLESMSDSELYDRIMNERIGGMTNHFRGAIDAWDVVNEVVYWGGQTDPRAVSRLAAKLSYVEFTKYCLMAARKGNPQATLLMNDNNFSDPYLNLLKQLVDASGQPLFDVVGVQSHFHMAPDNAGRWTDTRTWAVCERFAPLGKPIHFTEISILSTTDNCGSCENVPTTPEGEAWQSEEVVRFYKMLFSHPSVEAATMWDFTDQNSWMGTPAGLLRADMTPKPAYYALKHLIKEEWATNTTQVTDNAGEIHLRAFRGKYNFTVTLPDGTTLSPQYDAVKKGQPVIDLAVF
ncbi:hypothetical protein AGMMS49965_08060 [Bacteroidia bacterium]|nr:hypothetical protein AGMMS49965_08060 [Bacteroidia bacterium]